MEDQQGVGEPWLERLSSGTFTRVELEPWQTTMHEPSDTYVCSLEFSIDGMRWPP